MLVAAFGASACYKFAGSGGFPSDLKTVAILPFDNQTPSPEVQRDLNEAIQLASKSPMARIGSIEVRPVMELERSVALATHSLTADPQPLPNWARTSEAGEMYEWRLFLYLEDIRELALG